VNVLYLGHYREDSTLGYSSRRYISALQTIPIFNISVRPVYLQTKTFNISEEILECENNQSKHYELVIQDTLPDYYEYNAKFGKNVCVPKVISRNLQHTGWIQKINIMDEVWVNSFFAEKSLRESGVTKLIRVLPEPFNVDIEALEKLSTDQEFNFYTMTSSSEQDNLISLLIAYITEFDKNDRTRLIIKTNDEDEAAIKKIMNNAYTIAKKNTSNVNEPVIIMGGLEENKIHELFSNSDCYIDVSKGSYTTSSCIEALIHKKICIVTEGTANASYVTEANGFVIDSQPECIISSCKYSTHNISNIYETWSNPSIKSIRHKMRQAYCLSDTEKQNKIDSIDVDLFNNKKFSRYVL
jgi:hypothetical protein